MHQNPIGTCIIWAPDSLALSCLPRTNLSLFSPSQNCMSSLKAQMGSIVFSLKSIISTAKICSYLSSSTKKSLMVLESNRLPGLSASISLWSLFCKLLNLIHSLDQHDRCCWSKCCSFFSLLALAIFSIFCRVWFPAAFFSCAMAWSLS